MEAAQLSVITCSTAWPSSWGKCFSPCPVKTFSVFIYDPCFSYPIMSSWEVPSFVFLIISRSTARLLLGPSQATSSLGCRRAVCSVSPHGTSAPVSDQLCGCVDQPGGPTWTLDVKSWALSCRGKHFLWSTVCSVASQLLKLSEALLVLFLQFRAGDTHCNTDC